jgi:hypothetical protein
MMTLNDYPVRRDETDIALADARRLREPQPVPRTAAQVGQAAWPVQSSVATPGPTASVAAGEGSPPTSPAQLQTSPQQRVIDAHRRNPMASASAIATELGVGRSYVRTVAETFGLELPKPTRADGVTLKDRVIALHKQHPELTKREAARHLGAPRGSVAAYSWALGLHWAAGRPGRPPRVAEPAANDSAPARPMLRNPFAPLEDDEEPRKIRRPQSEIFWLRDADGRYLDRYCTGMTRDRRAAWTGTAQQLVGCRRKFEIARELHGVPVETRRAFR